MAGFLQKMFGGGPEKLIDKSERMAADESWPEAIHVLEKALSQAPETDMSLRSDIERRIRDYSKSYRLHLMEAVESLLADGDREKAAQLSSIALSFTSDERERDRIREVVAEPDTTEEETSDSVAPTTDEAPSVPEPNDDRSDIQIKGLADSYSEALEPDEKGAIFARPAMFLRGFVLWNEGRYEEARRAFMHFLADSPHDPFGLLYLGLSLHPLGRGEQAIDALEKSVRHEPSLAVAVMALAQIKRGSGMASEAADHLEKLYDVVKDDPDRFSDRRRDEVVFSTIASLIAAGRAERAESVYEFAIEKGFFGEHLPFEARFAAAGGNIDLATRKWELFLKAPIISGSIMGQGASTRIPGPGDYEQAGDFFSEQHDHNRAANYYQKAALAITQRAHGSGEAIPLQLLLRYRKKLAFSFIGMENWNEAEAIAKEMERIEPPPPEAQDIRAQLPGALP